MTLEQKIELASSKYLRRNYKKNRGDMDLSLQTFFSGERKGARDDFMAGAKWAIGAVTFETIPCNCHNHVQMVCDYCQGVVKKAIFSFKDRGAS